MCNVCVHMHTHMVSCVCTVEHVRTHARALHAFAASRLTDMQTTGTVQQQQVGTERHVTHTACT